MTTALILLPLGGGLLVWLLPWSRFWAGSIATLISLVEVGLWILSIDRFHFGRSTLQLEQRHTWFRDLGVSYHVGQFGFSLWLVGLTAIVGAATKPRKIHVFPLVPVSTRSKLPWWMPRTITAASISSEPAMV